MLVLHTTMGMLLRERSWRSRGPLYPSPKFVSETARSNGIVESAILRRIGQTFGSLVL